MPVPRNSLNKQKQVYSLVVPLTIYPKPCSKLATPLRGCILHSQRSPQIPRTPKPHHLIASGLVCLPRRSARDLPPMPPLAAPWQRKLEKLSLDSRRIASRDSCKGYWTRHSKATRVSARVTTWLVNGRGSSKLQ